jgi:hypothetical protein
MNEPNLPSDFSLGIMAGLIISLFVVGYAFAGWSILHG